MNALKYGFLLWLLFCCQTLYARDTSPLTDAIPVKSSDKGYVLPFQIFDNIYYVGDKWVSSYLIATDDGLILVDTLEYPYSKWLPDNIAHLGFDPKDVKWLFITHGHSDHASGAGWLQQRTGTKLLMTSESLRLINRFFANNPDIKAPDQNTVTTVKDNQKLTLGNTELLIHTTPGHTDGAISIQLQAKHGDKYHKALIFGGIGTNYQTLALADKYLKSVEKLKTLHERQPFYINLANHPHRAQLFEKTKQRTENKDPLVDKRAFSNFLQQLQRGGELRRRELTYKQQNSK